jgi:hypothetical protein
MTPTLTCPPATEARLPALTTRLKARADCAPPHQQPDIRDEHPVLGRYLDAGGDQREVVVEAGLNGSVLVVDLDGARRGESRLVAHLGSDEPRENAALMCEHYLQDIRRGGCRCRPVTIEDYGREPFAEPAGSTPLGVTAAGLLAEPVDGAGRSYRLERLHTGMSIPELRWRQYSAGAAACGPRPVSMREAIACLQEYDSVRSRTEQALAMHDGDTAVSTTVLRAELERVKDSPIVLNRRLRTVALETIERQQLSMSEIAIRCGRVKHDRRGNLSGETSWLARRLGILPEGGQDEPTPWIHSDVLALISRRGLGISPREVELG